MQIDPGAAELSASVLRTEVCIIGAGIAGLLLAQKLAQAGSNIVLLEAGTLLPAAALEQNRDPEIGLVSAQQQGDGRVEMAGYLHPGSAAPAPDAYGGTSLTWGGQLLPLSSDLEASPWPLAPDQLAPFYAEAEATLGVNGRSYEGARFFSGAGSSVPPLLAGIAETTVRVSKFAPFSHRNLARTVGQNLLQHPRVRVVLQARATELLRNVSEDGALQRVEAAIAELAAGQRVRIEAERFIVAAGTLDSVRLLLASRRGDPRGLGNDHDQLGRNLHDHLTLTAATFTGSSRDFILEQWRPWVLPGLKGSTVHSAKVEASPGLRERLALEHVMAHLTVEEREDSPIHALRATLRDRQGRGSARALRENVARLPALLAGAARLAWSARVHKRRYVSPQARVSLRLNCAQKVPSLSTITVGEARDERDQLKPVFTWAITREDCTTLIRFAGHLRQCLEQFTLKSEVHWNPSLFAGEGEPISALLPDLADARHLMGGALMGTDPRTSVVDPDLRVHGLANLYVASLATFPDGGAQLPTLTLMALVLRLAAHLSR